MAVRTYRLAIAGVLAVAAAAGLWNASTLSPDLGYDAAQHQQYAHLLVEEGRRPAKDVETRALYDNPPGFYAVAGAAGKAGKRLGMKEDRAILYLNVLFALGGAMLVLGTARELWPERPALHVASLAFAAWLPLVGKATALYHPAMLAMLLAAASVYVAVRLVVRRDLRLLPALGLTALLMAGIVVLPSSLWVYGAVLVALGAAAWPGRDRGRLRTLGVVLGISAILAVPLAVWQDRAGVPLLGNLPELTGALDRRPPEFFTALGLPDVLTEPYRPAFANLMLPTAYSDVWGDYFGNFAWNASVLERPDSGLAAELAAQNWIGFVPTILALAGVLALGALTVRASPGVAVIPALALLSLVGFVYYAANAVTPDGDTIKAIFMTSAAPAWALGFGFAVDRVARGRGRYPLAGALVLCALVNVRFLVTGSPLGGLL